MGFRNKYPGEQIYDGAGNTCSYIRDGDVIYRMTGCVYIRAGYVYICAKHIRHTHIFKGGGFCPVSQPIEQRPPGTMKIMCNEKQTYARPGDSYVAPFQVHFRYLKIHVIKLLSQESNIETTNGVFTTAAS